MAISRRFLVLWVFSAFALIRVYFLIGRDGLPLSVLRQISKPPLTTGNGGAQASNFLHDNYLANEDNENSLVEAPPEGTVLTTSQNEGLSNKEPYDEQLSSPTPALSTQMHDLIASSTSTAQEQAGLRISLVETGGSHQEVTAALVYAFGSQKNSTISLFFAEQRYGMEKIINEFKLSSPIASTKSSSDFKNAVRESLPPQVLISTTCELDIVRLAESFEVLLAGGKTYLFCVIHHADRWAKSEAADKVRPWVEKQLVDFVALSAHTAQFLQTESIAKWDYDSNVTVQVLPPVFPVNIPEPLDGSDPENKLSLAMQGDYDASRRDYAGIFEQLGDIVENAKNISQGKKTTSPEVALHLIGHGSRPPVPEVVEQQTVFDENLSYIDFYALLSRSFALLPAFASKEYFDRKASSSVPASMIGGVPLVASEELLKAYSYLPRDAAWVSHPGEGEMDVIRRVIHLADEHAKKRGIIQAACQSLVKENIEHVSKWVDKGLRE
jgi:hypothetical protein